MDYNLFERFECRFIIVKILDSLVIMFKGMEDIVFGMWSVYGEGMVFVFVFFIVILYKFIKIV